RRGSFIMHFRDLASIQTPSKKRFESPMCVKQSLSSKFLFGTVRYQFNERCETLKHGVVRTYWPSHQVARPPYFARRRGAQEHGQGGGASCHVQTGHIEGNRRP